VPAAYVFLRRIRTVGRASAGAPGDAGARGDPGEVLLLLREGTGYLDGHWAGVAGHVEADESCIAAAVREAREEVGVEIRAEDLEPVCAMHRTHGNHEWIDERADFFFQAWTWSGEPSLREPAKAAALRWWPLQALPDPTAPHEALVLRRLLGGRVPAILTFGFDVA
jgi:8-oxo-dGTP diphosphatase